MWPKIPIFLGSVGVCLGTLLQLAVYWHEEQAKGSEIRSINILRWLLDPVILKDDEKGDHPDHIRGRMYRRKRSGWLWLFLGSFFAMIGSLLDLFSS